MSKTASFNTTAKKGKKVKKKGDQPIEPQAASITPDAAATGFATPAPNFVTTAVPALNSEFAPESSTPFSNMPDAASGTLITTPDVNILSSDFPNPTLNTTNTAIHTEDSTSAAPAISDQETEKGEVEDATFEEAIVYTEVEQEVLEEQLHIEKHRAEEQKLVVEKQLAVKIKEEARLEFVAEQLAITEREAAAKQKAEAVEKDKLVQEKQATERLNMANQTAILKELGLDEAKAYQQRVQELVLEMEAQQLADAQEEWEHRRKLAEQLDADESLAVQLHYEEMLETERNFNSTKGQIGTPSAHEQEFEAMRQNADEILREIKQMKAKRDLNELIAEEEGDIERTTEARKMSEAEEKLRASEARYKALTKESATSLQIVTTTSDPRNPHSPQSRPHNHHSQVNNGRNLPNAAEAASSAAYAQRLAHINRPRTAAERALICAEFTARTSRSRTDIEHAYGHKPFDGSSAVNNRRNLRGTEREAVIACYDSLSPHNYRPGQIHPAGLGANAGLPDR
ncbi:hypothetical protein T440DRAFT_517656 [Plenodomus tracheiphilus IPT5]|uniref:Uncharacterized protein n=1 Tax=Plenodomus tracheiphilus IPT5 TaxID=1408161 RepID=A0A6A7BA05_9PLEO|nr:hypothetical protein T440DRAFT_517656 [Plenodomus tracheiphilus IPT5]